jgi:hypothetical protein
MLNERDTVLEEKEYTNRKQGGGHVGVDGVSLNPMYWWKQFFDAVGSGNHDGTLLVLPV